MPFYDRTSLRRCRGVTRRRHDDTAIPRHSPPRSAFPLGRFPAGTARPVAGQGRGADATPGLSLAPRHRTTSVSRCRDTERCHNPGAAVRTDHGAVVPCDFPTSLPRHRGTVRFACRGVAVSRFLRPGRTARRAFRGRAGADAPSATHRRGDTEQPHRRGAVRPTYFSATTPCHHCVSVPWRYGVAQRPHLCTAQPLCRGAERPFYGRASVPRYRETVVSRYRRATILSGPDRPPAPRRGRGGGTDRPRSSTTRDAPRPRRRTGVPRDLRASVPCAFDPVVPWYGAPAVLKYLATVLRPYPEILGSSYCGISRPRDRPMFMLWHAETGQPQYPDTSVSRYRRASVPRCPTDVAGRAEPRVG